MLLTLPPPMRSTSISSEDPNTTTTGTAGLQESLPPPELSELRSMSQHSNYTSASSAGSCEDIHMIQSPEHPPLPNESHDPVINEFPSVGPPDEISMVEMSLNENQFKLPNDYEYSPATKRKQFSDLSVLDQVIFLDVSGQQKQHASPDSSHHNSLDTFPSALPSKDIADDPNEEFVLPPPPQFQGDNTEYPSSSTSYQSPMLDVEHQSQRDYKQRLINSSSSSNIQDGVEKSSASTSKAPITLKGGCSKFSASDLMEMGNMDEEVLLTDMLKSLNQMAEKKYHEEV